MEIGTVERQFLTMLALLIEMILQITLILLAIMWINPLLAILCLFIFSIPVFIPKVFEKKLEAISKERKNFIQRHVAKLISWLNSFELIKVFEIEDKLKLFFARDNEKYINIDVDFSNETAKNIGVSFLASLGAQALIIVISGYFLFRDAIVVGEFVTITGLVGYLRIPSYWISTYYQMIISTRPIRQSLDKFIRQPINVKGENQLIKEQDEVCISYENVSYSYDKKRFVLKDFNLDIQGNKKVLITGASGSGKTTMMQLLLDYDEPDLGRVCINGIPVQSIGNLEEQVTISKQEAILFSDTIKNNVAMYEPSISDKEIIWILENVGMYQGENYDSLEEMVQEDGTNFSGGEKKRISLARALLKKGKILILDEPLANIDQENLAKIENYILNIKDKVVIVITHQFNKEKLKEFDLILNYRDGVFYEELYS